MNSEHVRVFSVVARNGSIAQSCDELHMSRQNISRIMRTLEADLGQQLLLRSCNGVRPTKTGYLLLEYASKFEALEKEFYSKVSGSPSSDYYVLCCNQLKNTVGNVLGKHHPTPYKFNLYYREMKTILLDLSSEAETKFDLLFLCGLEEQLEAVAQEAGYLTQTICHQKLGVVAGASHPLAKTLSSQTGVSTSELNDCEFTSISDSPLGVGLFVEILRNQTGTELNVVSRSNAIDTFKDVVLSGNYCCLSDYNAFASLFSPDDKTTFLPIRDISFDIAYLCLHKPSFPARILDQAISAVSAHMAK